MRGKLKSVRGICHAGRAASISFVCCGASAASRTTSGSPPSSAIYQRRSNTAVTDRLHKLTSEMVDHWSSISPPFWVLVINFAKVNYIISADMRSKQHLEEWDSQTCQRVPSLILSESCTGFAGRFGKRIGIKFTF